MAVVLASSGPQAKIKGLPGSEIDVPIDLITSIARRHARARTSNSLERGRPITTHRIREAEQVVLQIICSDVEPTAGAQLVGLWEQDHAKKTLDRMLAAQAYEGGELTIWTGTEFIRPAGGGGVRSWVLDDIDHTIEGAEYGVLRATLTFGEQTRYSTAFTSALPDVAPDFEDVVGGGADRGRQSPVAAGDVLTGGVY